MADPVPRQRRYAPRMPAARRREQLLDAALAVLVRDGYGAVSVEAIAREAGVTRPVVYALFEGLEPLLLALLDRSQQQALESVVPLLPATTDLAGLRLDDWLLEAIGSLLDVVRARPEVWRPVLGLTENAPPVVRRRIEDTQEVLRAQLEQVLRRGLAAQGAPDLDVEVLAHLLMVTGERLARLSLADPDAYPRDRLVAALRPLLAAARQA
ncbi:TetR/AcrR family transcriptional regulator [Nocardioides sp.]|uniref:TetR/AcrR family transcriptional regulator n=1 Tax=Nocardioides sp. TaxID=35761 RepID=UPI0035171C7C